MNKSVFENKGNIIKLCCQEIIDYYKNSKETNGIYWLQYGENWQSPFIYESTQLNSQIENLKFFKFWLGRKAHVMPQYGNIPTLIYS